MNRAVTVGILLVSTAFTTQSYAHGYIPSWRSAHGLPPLSWDCPGDPDKPCRPPAGYTPSPTDPKYPPPGGTQPANPDPVNPDDPSAQDPAVPDPIEPPKDPKPVPPPKCDARALPREMREFCKQAYDEGTLDLTETPECKGWYTYWTAGVLPTAGDTCAPPPPVDPGKGCPNRDSLFANPFSPASLHHRPVPAGAVFAGEGDESTQTIKRVAAGGAFINSGNGYGVDVYQGGDGSGSNIGGRDSVYVVLNQQTGIAVETYHADKHRTWDARGLGYGPGKTGFSASGVAGMFGLMRGPEVNTPGCEIAHVHQVAFQRDAMKNQTVGPATNIDGFCHSDGCNGGMPYGALLAIPPGVEIPDGLSEPGRRMAASLQQYGVYVIDATRRGAIFRADQFVDGGVKQQLTNDLTKLLPLLRRVVND